MAYKAKEMPQFSEIGDVAERTKTAEQFFDAEQNRANLGIVTPH